MCKKRVAPGNLAGGLLQPPAVRKPQGEQMEEYLNLRGVTGRTGIIK